MIQKKMKDQQKRELDEKERKAKANLKVMAKIAYKEWKERKIEDDRMKRKIKKMNK